MEQQDITGRCTATHSGDRPFRPITTHTAWASAPTLIADLFPIHPRSCPRIAHLPIATDGMGRAVSIVANIEIRGGLSREPPYGVGHTAPV